MERLRKERNAVASKMKGKLEQSELQRLIEEGDLTFLFSSLVFVLTAFVVVGQFSAYHTPISTAGKNLKDSLSALEENLLKLSNELQQEAQCIPNMTHPDTPIGDEDHSIVRKTVWQFYA